MGRPVRLIGSPSLDVDVLAILHDESVASVRIELCCPDSQAPIGAQVDDLACERRAAQTGQLDLRELMAGRRKRTFDARSLKRSSDDREDQSIALGSVGNREHWRDFGVHLVQELEGRRLRVGSIAAHAAVLAGDERRRKGWSNMSHAGQEGRERCERGQHGAECGVGWSRMRLRETCATRADNRGDNQERTC